MRLGATSLYLHAMQTIAQPTARIFLKDSNFELKTDVPIVMAGPGTGVVPFIAFIDEREVLGAKNIQLSEASLYFGCKDKSNDFIYRD